MLSLYKFFTGKGQMVAFLLGVGLVLITVLTAITGIKGAGYEVGEDFNKILKSEGNTETFEFFNLVAFLPTLLVIAIIAIILIFGIKQLISNPKGSMKILAGFGIVLVLAFIFFTMADPETTGKIGKLHTKFGVTDTASKWISGGIKSVLTLLGAGVLFIVISEIRNIFN